jgi:hypothetical protein
MDTNLIVLAAAAILIIAALAVLGWLYLRKRRSTTAGRRKTFGTEYECAVKVHGSERKAEARLADREKRVDGLTPSRSGSDGTRAFFETMGFRPDTLH